MIPAGRECVSHSNQREKSPFPDMPTVRLLTISGCDIYDYIEINCGY